MRVRTPTLPIAIQPGFSTITAFHQAVMVENPGWMAIGNVGVRNLT